MSSGVGIVASQQELERFIRSGPAGTAEVSTVASSGDRTTACAVKVKSHISYNVYNVCAVQIEDAGLLPFEVAPEVQAFNLAESFLQNGQLAAGTYAVMCRVGGKNVFYAKP